MVDSEKIAQSKQQAQQNMHQHSSVHKIYNNRFQM